ncbi:hypothetical protein BC567DRAFT_251882 [Phyllosticta citribraziliensis]
MTPVATKHKRSLEILHGLEVRDAPHKDVAVIYGPSTYVDRVYGARNGGRLHPSEINTTRAADVVKQHLGFGPAPTFRTSERQDRGDRDPIELKIPKQRKRAHANGVRSLGDCTQEGDTEIERTCPAGQNETTQKDQEKHGGGIEDQQSDGSQHTSIEQDELPQSISEELYEAFTPPASWSAEDHSLAIATDPESSPSDTEDSLSVGGPTVPTDLTVDGSTAFSAHCTSDSKVSSLGSSFNEDAPISKRKRRRRICSSAITATFHMD